MVCGDCEKKKLTTICVPDKWTDGARNVASTSSNAGIKVGKTNKLLSKLKSTSAMPSAPVKFSCRICKNKVQTNMNYCNDCAHKKGICTMCGKKVVDVSQHKMSLV